MKPPRPFLFQVLSTIKSICFDLFSTVLASFQAWDSKIQVRIKSSEQPSSQQTTSIWKFLGLLSVFYQKIILISAGQDLIGKNASLLMSRKISILSWTTSFLDKINTCMILLYSGHVQILPHVNNDVSCVIFCYLGKLASSDFPVAMDRHNCDMRRRYKTHPIVLRSRGIRQFKLKYVDLQKRKHQIFASQIIVFSLKYWEVRTRMTSKKMFFNASVQLSGLLITWLKC